MVCFGRDTARSPTEPAYSIAVHQAIIFPPRRVFAFVELGDRSTGRSTLSAWQRRMARRTDQVVPRRLSSSALVPRSRMVGSPTGLTEVECSAALRLSTSPRSSPDHAAHRSSRSSTSSWAVSFCAAVRLSHRHGSRRRLRRPDPLGGHQLGPGHPHGRVEGQHRRPPPRARQGPPAVARQERQRSRRPRWPSFQQARAGAAAARVQDPRHARRGHPR